MGTLSRTTRNQAKNLRYEKLGYSMQTKSKPMTNATIDVKIYWDFGNFVRANFIGEEAYFGA